MASPVAAAFVTASETHCTVDAVWRIESAKIIAGLARMVRDVGLAEELGRELELRQEMAETDFDAALDDDIGDDLVRLMFTACHPVLPAEGRVALTPRGTRRRRATTWCAPPCAKTRFDSRVSWRSSHRTRRRCMVSSR